MKIIKAIRVEQWLKNLLIFTPFFTAGNLDLQKLISLTGLFIGFSLIVSSTYIVNDLIDIEADKIHPIKKFRPIPSGYLSSTQWYMISGTFLILGFIIVFYIQQVAVVYVTMYLVITLAYSLKLKFVKFFDILCVSLLFTLRIFVGGAPVSIPISNFLILFTFSTSLAIISGKKLSILKNKDITNTKIKEFLKNNYESKSLEYLLYVSFFISVLTYSLWIFYIKLPEVNLINLLYLIISILFLILFIYSYLKEFINNTTEDIFDVMKNNRSLFYYALAFVVFSLLGIF